LHDALPIWWRSDRDLRGSRPSRLVSRIQSAVRHVRSRRVSGRLTLAGMAQALVTAGAETRLDTGCECDTASDQERPHEWGRGRRDPEGTPPAPQVLAYATVPNSAPTPAVTAMASAPQNVTRRAPAVMPAPPVWAANPPSSARNAKEVPATSGIRLFSGTIAVTRSGMAAPAAKLPADAKAAR